MVIDDNEHPEDLWYLGCFLKDVVHIIPATNLISKCSGESIRQSCFAAGDRHRIRAPLAVGMTCGSRRGADTKRRVFGIDIKQTEVREPGMNHKTRVRYEARAQIIKALGHPSRLFMVDELSKGERCVCELRDLIGADISTVSKHLSVLKQAGIVVDEKRGLQVWYSLRVPCVLKFFDCIEDVLKASIARASQAASKR